MRRSGRSGIRNLAITMAAMFVLATPHTFANAETSTATDSSAIESEVEDLVMMDNISINGKSVGGMTFDEVIKALGGTLDDVGEAPVTITSDYGDINLTLNELGLSDNTKDVVEKAFKYGNSGNILQRYRDREMLKSNPIDYTVKRTIDAKILSQYVENELGRAMDGLNQYTLNKNDDGTVSVLASGDSFSVDAKATKAAIEKQINADGYSGGGVTTEMVLMNNSQSERRKQLTRIKDLLGTYTTDYSSSGGSRATNVQRAASLVDGHVLFPGDDISVYNCIAPIEVSNGYELAHAFVGNEVVDSPGGGVCQVASTLYNAVIRAELEVLQRDCHSMMVSYVPISADATIAGGFLDLRFRNNLDAPIYIEAGYDGAYLTFNIYGEEYRPSNRTIEFESIQTGVINPPAEPIYTEDKSIPAGTQQVKSEAVTGYTGELWKYVYVDGVRTEEVLINTSLYDASPAKILVNTDPATNKPEENQDEKEEKKKKKKETEEQETEAPTEEKTEKQKEEPTEEPTEQQTEEPTEAPTEEPTEEQTEEPTEAPTEEPTEEPTEAPTEEPTEAPTEEPTEAPVEQPSDQSVDQPSDQGTDSAE